MISRLVNLPHYRIQYGVNHYEPVKKPVKHKPVRPAISFSDLCPSSVDPVLLPLDLSLSGCEEPLAAPPSVMSGRDGSGRDGTAYSVVISVLYNTDNTGWHLCVLLYYTYFVLIQYKYVLCIT